MGAQGAVGDMGGNGRNSWRQWGDTEDSGETKGSVGAPGGGGKGHLAGNLGVGGFPSGKLRTPGHPSKAVKAGRGCVEGGPRRRRW